MFGRPRRSRARTLPPKPVAGGDHPARLASESGWPRREGALNVLIVFAHPEPASFSAALKDVAVETLGALGHAVEVSDLYADRFQPAGGRDDFTHRITEPFDYLAEQRRATAGGSSSAEILREQRKLGRADLLMFNFPMWWFGAPAVLKGWIDRVLAAGFAYDRDSRFETGRFRGRRGMLTVTTGSLGDRYSKDGPLAYAPMQETLHPLHRGVFEYIGLTVLDPFVAYGVARASDAERQAQLDAYRLHLERQLGG